MIYSFDEFELDTDRFELRRDGVVQPVEPQVFSLIELLVTNHDRLVSKDEINLRIWGGRVVSEAAVSSRVRSARRAIGDDGSAQRLIRTVHNRGFRFVGAPQVEQGFIGDRQTTVTSVENVAPPVQPEPAALADSRPSIAVLPFQMLSADERYETLSDAISHDIIVELSRLHWMFVIARGSSFRFRGPNVDLNAAAEVLGVRYILSGSLAIHGTKSVVTVELSQAADGRVYWAERFEGAVDDLLNLRLTVAAGIVTALEIRIPIAEAMRASTLPTQSLDAWSAYHRGLWHMYRFNRHDNEIATAMFERARSVDPDFARAYAGLSFTHFQNAFVGYSKTPGTDRDLSREFADRSLELDPFDPFANLTMGRAMMLAGDLDGSVSWFDRSVDLSPNYAFAIYNRALVTAIAGDGLESEQSVTRAMALSPVDPLHYAMLATRALSYIVRQDYDAACSWADRAAREPNAHVHIRTIAALAHELAGDHTAAEKWASEIRRTSPGYKQDQFFQAFPFREEDTLAIAQAALKRLAI